MPYTIVKRKDNYYVYKEDDDGNPTGSYLGKHESLKDAKAQQRALYANEQVEIMEWDLATEQAGENKGYVYLPVRWTWEIERLQTALGVVFGGEGWNWNDSSTYHITLAYASNATKSQLLNAGSAASDLGALEFKVTGVDFFENPNINEKAVYLKVEKTDEMAQMQRSVYESLTEQGVELSPYSNPETWVPHITIAYAPMDSNIAEFESWMWLYANKVCVARSDYDVIAELPLKWIIQDRIFEDGTAPLQEMKSNSEDWTSESIVEKIEENNRLIQSLKLEQVVDEIIEESEEIISEPVEREVQEMDRETIRWTFISEMRGIPPKVNLPADIDIDELRKDYKKIFGDEDLEFVTLPIGQVNAESRNGRTYGKTPVEELVDQVNEMRPEGMWGHLTDEEMATRYDPPAIRWLAAKIDKEGIAWGKGLPLTVPTREYYRLARATRARVGTSIAALAEMKGNEVQHIELMTIDIADPRRVGIPMTSAMVHLTQEQMGDGVSESAVNPSHDVFVRVREQVSIEKREEDMEIENQAIAELTTERDSLNGRIQEFETRVAEMETRLTELQQRETNYLATIGELLSEYIVAEVREQVAVEDARDLIAEQVITLQPQNRDAVKSAVETVLNKESVKKLLKTAVVSEMGPSQPQQPTPRQTDESPEDKYLEPLPKIHVPQRSE